MPARSSPPPLPTCVVTTLTSLRRDVVLSSSAHHWLASRDGQSSQLTPGSVLSCLAGVGLPRQTRHVSQLREREMFSPVRSWREKGGGRLQARPCSTAVQPGLTADTAGLAACNVTQPASQSVIQPPRESCPDLSYFITSSNINVKLPPTLPPSWNISIVKNFTQIFCLYFLPDVYTFSQVEIKHDVAVVMK